MQFVKRPSFPRPRCTDTCLPKFHYLNVSKFAAMASDSLTFHDLPGHCSLVNIPFLFPFLRVHTFISKPVPLHLLQHMFVASFILSSMVDVHNFIFLHVAASRTRSTREPTLFYHAGLQGLMFHQTHSFTYAFHRAELVGMNSCRTYEYIDRTQTYV